MRYWLLIAYISNYNFLSLTPRNRLIVIRKPDTRAYKYAISKIISHKCEVSYYNYIMQSADLSSTQTDKLYTT